MQRRCATKGDHGIFAEIFAIFHGMHAGSIGHVFVHHFRQPKCCGFDVHLQEITQFGF